MASTYGTIETRQELALLSGTLPPVLRGLYGDPINVDTLGGFISWHYGAYFALLAGLWSILALSSTLAGEARRGQPRVRPGHAALPTGRRDREGRRPRRRAGRGDGVDRAGDLGHRRRLREDARRRHRTGGGDRLRRRSRCEGPRRGIGRIRPRVPRRARCGRRPGGRAHGRGLRAQQLPDACAGVRRAREPDLVLVDARPPSARRPGGLDGGWPGPGRLGRAARDRRRSLRTTRRRRDERDPDAAVPALRCSASGVRSADRSASCCRPASRGVSASGCTASSWRSRAGPSPTSWHGRRASWTPCGTSFPAST